MTFKADAAYHRAWRAKRGARTGVIGRPATAPCGTIAAYRRHRSHGMKAADIDTACNEAWNAYQRGRYAATKAGVTAKPRRRSDDGNS